LAAGLAHGAVEVGRRVQGQHVFLFDMKGRQGSAEAVIKQLALDPHLITHAFFRLEGLATGIQATIGLERRGGVGKHADFRRELVEQAGALSEGVVGLAALGVVAGEVVGALFEVFEARTDHAAQAVCEDDLVLQVQCVAFGLLEEVGTGAFAVGFGLAVHRLVDVDGIVACDRRHALFLAVILVLGTDQQFMLPTADIEHPA